MKILKTINGVSLIEIMIVIAIIGITGIGIYMFLINMTKGWALSQAKMNLQQQQAAVFDWLEHDIQNARKSTFNNYLSNPSAEDGPWTGGNPNTTIFHSGIRSIRLSNPGSCSPPTLKETAIPSWANAIVYGGWAFCSDVSNSTAVSINLVVKNHTERLLFNGTDSYTWQCRNGTIPYAGGDITLTGSLNAKGDVFFDDFFIRPWKTNPNVEIPSTSITSKYPIRFQDVLSGREVKMYLDGNNLIRVDANNNTAIIASKLSQPTRFILRSWQLGMGNITTYDVDQVWVRAELEQTWMNNSLIRQINSWFMPRQR